MAGECTPQLDPHMAEALLHEGATFLFLDVPQGTEFGIDYNTWTVGPRFKGVKMIPAGVHFIYFSAVGSTKDVSPRTGFFYNFSRQEVLLKRWDNHTEGILVETVQAEPEVLQQNRREFDRFLGPYPYESYRKWVSLTSHISPRLLSRLQPLSGIISAVAAFQSEPSTTADRQKMRETSTTPSTDTTKPTENQLPDMKLIEGTEIRFTKLPERKYPENATPAEITKYNMDHTYVLTELMTNTYGEGSNEKLDENMDILGEIQFAFVCFLIGQNYDAFEQWKHLVHLLCWCEEGLSLYPALFTNFISLLHHHLNEIPQDFFVDIVTADNFLVQTLHMFFAGLESLEVVGSPERAALRTRGLKFRDNLERKFKWNFTEESDEYAPVVVE